MGKKIDVYGKEYNMKGDVYYLWSIDRFNLVRLAIINAVKEIEKGGIYRNIDPYSIQARFSNTKR